MDRAFLATVVASVILLAGGVAGGLYLGGTGAFDDRPRVTPRVTQFDAGGIACTSDPATAPRVDPGNTTRGTFVVVRANLTVEGSRPTNATLDRVGLANYTLTYETVPTGTDCPAGETAVVRTLVSLQVPHRGGEPFRVTARYRDRTVFTLRNTPEGLTVTAPDGSAQAFRSVPPPSPSHSTR
ncbi:MAG: hypothetical protein ABEI11_00465 [Haloarculaceae archaeon]